MARQGANPRDGCAVETRWVAPLLAAFVDRWQRERPANRGRFAVEVPTMTAYEWLEAETGIGQDTLKKTARSRPDNATGAPEVLELREADRLVSALGLPHAFNDGTLPVIPNPRASAEARQACRRELAVCCGGSTV